MASGFGRISNELRIIPSCVQSGPERFPDRDTPYIASGRNNLTALSAELDLYFIAHLDKIRIYRPSFPTQSLGDLLYKWTLPSSAPGLQGYIDPVFPHAVNALLIDRLGTQEVLVCACDDGDVLLYHTQSLKHILNSPDVTAGNKPCPRPLFIENVGRSAWGLAVHRNARILAVSSNTHDVTIFAFGLTDDSILYNHPETEWQYPGRGKDVSLVFKAHATNIPNIAFFNSDLDKDGRWLVSTDLNGNIILWDLRERGPLKRIVPKPSLVHRNPRSGWSVACLDPTYFLLVETELDFLGCKSERDTGGTYDVTQARLRVRDASIHYPGPISAQAAANHRLVEDIRLRVAQIRDTLLESLQAQDLPDPNSPPVNIGSRPTTDVNPIAGEQRTELMEAIDADTDSDIDEDNEDDMEDEDDGDLQDMDLEIDSTIDFSVRSTSNERPRPLQSAPGFVWASGQATRNQAARLPVQVQIAEPINTSLFMDSEFEDSDDESARSSIDSDTGSSRIHRQTDDEPSRYEQSYSSSIQDGSSPLFGLTMQGSTSSGSIPFLLFHTGKDFVSLQKFPFEDLLIISRDPCHQHLPPRMGWLINHDRLHLTKVVPELNIIIAATATGRAVIYTMTRRISRHRSTMQDEYSLRLDCIIPFASQERYAQRPTSFLIGIAAAPIQGHEITSGSIACQRWRLILTYHDHTVLSYELWRNQTS